jgi:hypothetical protein
VLRKRLHELYALLASEETEETGGCIGSA